MRCPNCGHSDTRVADSRPSKDESQVRRRRKCEECGWRFSTQEILIPKWPSFAIKRDGGVESFDPDKLQHSMQLALQGRVGEEDIEAEQEYLFQEIQRRVGLHPESSIETEKLGELVLDVLRHHDPTACILYASVHEKVRTFDAWSKLIKREHKAVPKEARQRQISLLETPEPSDTKPKSSSSS